MTFVFISSLLLAGANIHNNFELAKFFPFFFGISLTYSYL